MRKIIVAFVLAVGMATVGVNVSARQDLNGPNPSPGDIGATVASPLGSAKVSAWAVVNGLNGQAVRGERILSSTRLGVGVYEVVIAKGNPPVPNNVTNCAFTANIGSIAFSGTEQPGFISTVGRAGNNAGIFIQTLNTAGAAADRSFHLLVTC